MKASRYSIMPLVLSSLGCVPVSTPLVRSSPGFDALILLEMDQLDCDDQSISFYLCRVLHPSCNFGVMDLPNG